ncbi:hypothetical protein [Terrarubrum flagellatum]|uniref:hypothetical protein n=1 Tax=Terrirubrum flagellatum TaxID=2895980 RepID=UPI0031451AFD
MPAYRVCWEIDDQTADSPEAAARIAWELMRRSESTANVFKVFDEDGEEHIIDLQEIDEDRATNEIAEKTCRAAGWEHGGDQDGFIFHKPTWGSWKAAASWEGTDQAPDGEGDRPKTYRNWQECYDAEFAAEG